MGTPVIQEMREDLAQYETVFRRYLSSEVATRNGDYAMAEQFMTELLQLMRKYDVGTEHERQSLLDYFPDTFRDRLTGVLQRKNNSSLV